MIVGVNTKDETTAEIAEGLGYLGGDLETARQVAIQTIYATTGDRRLKVRRGEILCITGWSSTTFDNRIKEGEKFRHDLYGEQRRLTEAEKRNRKGDRRSYRLYDLDKFDEWLKKEDLPKWEEVHKLRKAPLPPKTPSPAQTKTVAEAKTVPMVVLLNLKGEIDSISNHLATLIRELEAGKTLGLITLADAMTKYTWSSTKRREGTRKVWLRVLDAEQKQIEVWRELDRQRAIKSERAELEHVLPPSRHSGRRPARLGERHL